MVTETTQKEDNIVRSESLSIPLFDNNGLDLTLEVSSDDPDTVQVALLDNDGGEKIGGCDMVNFLALCNRSIELWDNENRPKAEA